MEESVCVCVGGSVCLCVGWGVADKALIRATVLHCVALGVSLPLLQQTAWDTKHNNSMDVSTQRELLPIRHSIPSNKTPQPLQLLQRQGLKNGLWL